MQASGGTDPRSALEKALALQPETIFFLSDGIFDAQVPQAIRGKNARKIPIHAIGFNNSGGEQVLKELAELNYGTFRYVRTR